MSSSAIDSPELDHSTCASGVDVVHAIRAACARVAPLWPLERFVAVNPYLGLADLRFDEAAERLARVAGAPTTLDARDYLDAVEQEQMTLEHVRAALATSTVLTGLEPSTFLERVGARTEAAPDHRWRVPTVADVARQQTGDDWSGFVADRISTWAGSYFDEGQSTWRPATTRTPLLDAWRFEASLDRTPEIMGLRGFRSVVRALPDDPLVLVEHALTQLQVPTQTTEVYLHAILLRNGGWAAHAARLAWERAQHGDDDDRVLQFLAVCAAWELALHATLGDGVATAFRLAIDSYQSAAHEESERAVLTDRVVLQDALDLAAHERVIEQFDSVAASAPPARLARPTVQAVFCIDVRSEVLRRHLEAVADDVETIGFAGFFGFPVEYVRLGHEAGDPQCPVLLTPAATARETVGGDHADTEAIRDRRLTHHVRRAWKSFKMGAVSCFSFVGPVGLAYLPKLVTDAAGITRPVPDPECEALPRAVRHHRAPSVDAIPLATRVQLAYGALHAMSLTRDFAPVVVLVGHGANTVNNPYAAGLDCGACGGHSGEANARVAAAILNDPSVRAELATRGVVIPHDTRFVGAKHDTTTDAVHLFGSDILDIPDVHTEVLSELERNLELAAARTRRERAPRLGITDTATVDAAVARRSTDWAQVRPEWGLAGCHSFVVAPRDRTRSLDLGGRAFLHSYDWRADTDFSVLELIMTAPMVVASWINLQYYASTVAPAVFGSGNKTLHNVVGQVGVLEGNSGDLRVGLPLQSVHDGDRRQHHPLRLMVVIEAPVAAIDRVLAEHPEIRQLVDHRWLYLFAMDDAGAITHRYDGDLRWTTAPMSSTSDRNAPVPEEALP